MGTALTSYPRNLDAPDSQNILALDKAAIPASLATNGDCATGGWQAPTAECSIGAMDNSGGAVKVCWQPVNKVVENE